jgi:hypothetical protein
LQELEDVSIVEFAKVDLKKALVAQKKVKKKIKDALTQHEEDKKKGYTEEELRWLREAEERKKRRKK